MEARQVPPRLVYIPRDLEGNSRGNPTEGKANTIRDDYKRETDPLPSYKVPPIPCIFYPWFKDHAKLMIYFHGIGEDLHVIQREIQFIRDMLMINILAVEYPGYGVNWNDGICSEERMRSDARQVLKFVLEETDLEMKHIILLGRSMGSAVAAAVAAEF